MQQPEPIVTKSSVLSRTNGACALPFSPQPNLSCTHGDTRLNEREAEVSQSSADEGIIWHCTVRTRSSSSQFGTSSWTAAGPAKLTASGYIMYTCMRHTCHGR